MLPKQHRVGFIKIIKSKVLAGFAGIIVNIARPAQLDSLSFRTHLTQIVSLKQINKLALLGFRTYLSQATYIAQQNTLISWFLDGFCGLTPKAMKFYHD